MLAQAGQDATWNRQQVANQLRSLLREYFPAAASTATYWTRYVQDWTGQSTDDEDELQLCKPANATST